MTRQQLHHLPFYELFEDFEDRDIKSKEGNNCIVVKQRGLIVKTGRVKGQERNLEVDLELNVDWN